MRLLRMRALPLAQLGRLCAAHTVDALVWIDEDGRPRVLKCKERISGSRLWGAKLKLLAMAACAAKLPPVVYAFDNSDWAVPRGRGLEPLPGVVRYVATEAHQALLWPTGPFVEAAVHANIMLSEDVRGFSAVVRDMDKSVARREAARKEWSERRPVVWWRGAPSGSPNTEDGMTWLPRAGVLRAVGGAEGFDVGWLEGHVSARLGHEISELNLRFGGQAKESPRQFCGNKYVLHCDGNTAAWGLALKLSTASLVLWVESLFTYREFYYALLRPWEHYVPVALDLRDLRAQRRCLVESPALDRLAARVARNGRRLLEDRLRPAATYCYVLRLLLALAEALEEPPTAAALARAGVPVDRFEEIPYFEGMAK